MSGRLDNNLTRGGFVYGEGYRDSEDLFVHRHERDFYDKSHPLVLRQKRDVTSFDTTENLVDSGVTK